MLTGVDRVQVVVRERHSAALAFGRLLGAEIVREDVVRLLGARRTVLATGVSEIDLLEPDGVGPVADFMARTKGGLFAAGFATADMGRLRAHLRARGVGFGEEDGRLFLSPNDSGIPGLQAVISSQSGRRPIGLLRHLYEVTLLINDSPAVVERIAGTFGLDASHFVPIGSSEYGYAGTLTLFHPDRLDRVEAITPNDPTKTMGRFFVKRGASLYMCFAEAEDLRPIRARLLEQAPTDWTGPRDGAAPDSLFIHPPALGGMMLGVSRSTFAWTWSGHPERVAAGAGT